MPVSTTSRKPRVGEVAGVDYNFVTADDFEAAVDAGEFLEWSRVGDNLYGTSAGAVRAASGEGKLCVLDTDLKGVQAVRSLDGLRPLCVWVSPPSFEALRARLESRGAADVDGLLGQAARDIEYSLTNRALFDQTIINDNLAEAVGELKQAVAGALGE